MPKKWTYAERTRLAHLRSKYSTTEGFFIPHLVPEKELVENRSRAAHVSQLYRHGVKSTSDKRAKPAQAEKKPANTTKGKRRALPTTVVQKSRIRLLWGLVDLETSKPIQHRTK